MDVSSITPSPQQLKALTHPVRVRMFWGCCVSTGRPTATSLAERLGLNSGSTSYHLRQLAQHGSRRGRHQPGQRPRALVESRPPVHDHRHRRAPPTRTTAYTMDAYLQSVVMVTTERLQRSVEELSALPGRSGGTLTTYSDWVGAADAPGALAQSSSS